ncbi:MAG TPA: DNA starvation/stationary phase protection protein [Rickettsiales bacterium]|nr:DNA starvation/stationary phase protection protein [Rickettsiales bacterium]
MAVAKIKQKQASLDIDIGLGTKARKDVAAALAQVLADTYTLQVKTQYYHWNVTGENFQALHTLFGTQYDELAAAVDEVAERIRALGHNTPGTLAGFLDLTSLKEDKYLPDGWQGMVYNLAAAHEAVTRAVREKLAIVQKAGDEGTADLLIRRLQEHEKAAWFLRSHL